MFVYWRARIVRDANLTPVAFSKRTLLLFAEQHPKAFVDCRPDCRRVPEIGQWHLKMVEASAQNKPDSWKKHYHFFWFSESMVQKNLFEKSLKHSGEIRDIDLGNMRTAKHHCVCVLMFAHHNGLQGLQLRQAKSCARVAGGWKPKRLDRSGSPSNEKTFYLFHGIGCVYGTTVPIDRRTRTNLVSSRTCCLSGICRLCSLHVLKSDFVFPHSSELEVCAELPCQHVFVFSFCPAVLSSHQKKILRCVGKNRLPVALLSVFFFLCSHPNNLAGFWLFRNSFTCLVPCVLVTADKSFAAKVGHEEE